MISEHDLSQQVNNQLRKAQDTMLSIQKNHKHLTNMNIELKERIEKMGSKSKNKIFGGKSVRNQPSNVASTLPTEVGLSSRIENGGEAPAT